MLIPLKNMPENARVWIYQANRDIADNELSVIREQAQLFFDQWAAHGAPLKNAYDLLYHRFLIIAVDESYNPASGCSIDASVHFVKQLQNLTSLDFFDRSQVAFLINNKVVTEPLTAIRDKVQTGDIKETSLTFNNTVTKKKELDEGWLVQANNSWLRKYFNKSTVTT